MPATLLRCALAAALLVPATTPAQETEAGPASGSNLDVLRSLAQRIVSSAIRESGMNGRVALTILPEESAWHIDGGVQAAFSGAGWSMTVPDSADMIAGLGVREGRVMYTEPRRDGFFGGKIVDRTVRLTLSVRMTALKTGTNVVFSDYTESATDTIAVSSIVLVENPVVPMTKGQLESEGVFSTLLEPVVMLGAIGVAVFLLFHVRS